MEKVKKTWDAVDRRKKDGFFLQGFNTTGISLLMGVQRKDRVTSQKPEEQKDARKAHGC